MNTADSTGNARALGTGEALLAPLEEAGPKTAGHRERGRKPNIVFILADDMGYGDIGALNFGASETPAIDSLMQEGTLLTQHYAGSAVCTPSRACLMTGRYPQRTGAPDLPGSGLNLLALRERTMADALGAAGYATGIVGKWHLGWDDPSYRPQARGFQDAATLERTAHWDWVMDYNGRRQKSDGRYLADVLTDDAISFIQRHRDEPFFLYLTHFAPHVPLEAPEEDIQTFRDKNISENVSRLYGMIRRMDRGIDRVLKELKRLNLEENTLVVFTSDNGPQFGASWTDRTSITRYNCGFHGHKDLVYEGGIRVPAILRWPVGLPERQTLHEMTHFSDWFPTLLDVAGTAVPADLEIDGQSMLPMLQGRKGIIAPRRFWQFSRYMPTATHNAAVREGDWKLVRPCADDVAGPVLGSLEPQGIAPPTHDWSAEPRYVPRLPEPLAPQLFNLIEDPGELNDLSAQHPERLARMGGQLDQWFESVMEDLHAIGVA